MNARVENPFFSSTVLLSIKSLSSRPTRAHTTSMLLKKQMQHWSKRKSQGFSYLNISTFSKSLIRSGLPNSQLEIDGSKTQQNNEYKSFRFRKKHP
jgi:hypothetical protein